MTYISTQELAVRIAEASTGMRRPNGMSAADAMHELIRLDADTAACFTRAALAAAEYIAECCNAANPGSVEVKRIIIQSGGIQ